MSCPAQNGKVEYRIMMSKRIPIPLVLLLGAYLALALLWNLSTPLFEGPDAYYHFAVIEHIGRTGELPPKENPEQHPWRQMTFHAPLYHLTAAQLIRGIDTSEFENDYRLNPHARPGEAGTDSNQNFVAHVGDPWRDTGLAARVVRVFSSLLGMLTLIGVYALGRLLAPERPGLALVAVGLVAFNPQYLHMHSIVSNDPLVIALNTWVLALFVHMLLRGTSTRQVILLAILLGLGALAKASGAVLIPVVGLGLFIGRFPEPLSWQRRFAYAAIVGVTVFLIAGWWYLNNWITLGDPAATAQIAQATGQRVGGITDLGGELSGMFASFWGVFGWFNILAPQIYYDFTVLVMVVSMMGVLFWIILGYRRKDMSQEPDESAQHAINWDILGYFVLFAVLFVASWWRFHLLVNAAQGRLLFPLIGLIALLIAAGLYGWSRWIAFGVVGVFALAAVSFPVLVVQPVFAVEPPIAGADWQPPPDAAAFMIREPWATDPCLRVWTQAIDWDGESDISVPTWWQAECAVSGYWSVFIHFVDVERETCVAGVTDYILMQDDSMLQGGNLPFPALEPGDVYAETLTLLPPPDLDSDRVWHVQVGLYDAAGTFIRAFVSEETAQPDIGIGQCAPETIQYRLGWR